MLDCRFRWSVALSIAFAWPGSAAAAPVQIELDSENDLIDEGFEHHSGDGTSTFAAGTMIVDTVGYEEWILYAPTASKWWDHVLPEKGWWIEARLAVEDAEPECSQGGPGLWIHDRGKLIKIMFGPDEVNTYPSGASAALDTSGFHVYRVEDFGDGTRHLLVDGDELLDLSGEIGGGGTNSLILGDLGGCAHSRVVWDYFAYDTFAPGSEDGDGDGDGISNAEDNCFAVANPDQADGDGDGRGDLCDPCPLDFGDDSDRDGVCDSDDACPYDPSTSEEPCPDNGTDVGTFEGGSQSLEAGAESLEAGSLSADGDSLDDGTGVSAGTSGGGSAGSGSAGSSGDGDGCQCRADRPGRASGLALVLLAGLRRRRAAPRRGDRGPS